MSAKDAPEPLNEVLVKMHDDAVADGQHYYFDPETGFLVMTALHHLERGSCCDTGCRHCPYP